METRTDRSEAGGFEDAGVAASIAAAMGRAAGSLGRRVSIMEVCGTHTMEIARNGLKSFLPPSVRLVSGPGCPVCVTPDAYIDAACGLAVSGRAMVATFGDMLRVPGSGMSLEQARAEGGDVRVVYSPQDALRYAEADASREAVFLGVGFETTAPLVAATVRKAAAAGTGNFSVLPGNKTVPPALGALLDDGETEIDGFLCPGHVSVITGPEPYGAVASRGVPCVIAGFEPLDILQAVLMLLRQILEGRSEVEVQYFRAVKKGGNPLAQSIMREVFEPCDSRWRGIGVIPGSGLGFSPAYREFDAAARFGLAAGGPDEDRGCSCGRVLKGAIEPAECGLFGAACTPEHPRGPCMVSSEGSCAAAYKSMG